MPEPVPKAGEALSEAVVSLTVLFAMSCFTLIMIS